MLKAYAHGWGIPPTVQILFLVDQLTALTRPGTASGCSKSGSEMLRGQG
jgi:hypothetical protein